MPDMPEAVRSGRGWAAGTCGEVLQGRLRDGRHVVVSLPIDVGSRAEATLRLGTAAQPRRGEIALAGGGKKAATAASRALAAIGLDGRSGHGCDLRLAVDSDLPVGRGLGTSTADIVAVVRAVADAAAASLADEVVHHLACSIEASDGVAFDGLVALDRDAGTAFERWPTPPSLRMLIVVPPTGFDTAGAGRPSDEATVDDLLSALAAPGLDAAGLAAVATESGHRHVGPASADVFTALLPLVAGSGALGVARAHTGTAAGLLFAHDDAGLDALAAAADRLRAEPPAGLPALRLLVAASPVARPSV